jgi:hypothetical protein
MGRKVRDRTSREHLREYLDLQPEVEDGRVVALSWNRNLDKKRLVHCRHLGKTMLVSRRHGWDDVTVVCAYHLLTRTESQFEIGKSDPGLLWPIFHRTDSRFQVQGFTAASPFCLWPS